MRHAASRLRTRDHTRATRVVAAWVGALLIGSFGVVAANAAGEAPADVPVVEEITAPAEAEVPAPIEAPAPEPEAPAPVETEAPAPVETEAPAPVESEAPTEEAVETNDAESGRPAVELAPVDELTPGDGTVAPLAAGPPTNQEVTRPFIYWEVRDLDGNLVPGATFEARSGNNGTWRSVDECVGASANSCSSNRDRDWDGGEYAVKSVANSATGTSVTAGSRYQVRTVQAPAGYEWVTSGTRDSDTPAYAWPSTGGSNRVLDMGVFQVRRLQTQPVCGPGYIYAISAGGQLQQIDPDGNVSNVGSPASDVSSFNGLGIGPDGNTVYAYERSEPSGQNQTSVSIARVWSYDVTTGVWTDVGPTVNSNTSSRTVQFVAGAVNLDTGEFYIGGFSTNGRVFRLWKMTPGAASATYVGHINTPGATGGTYNGDIAFDAAGNLYVVRGVGSTTTVFSITAANLAAASGSNTAITASQSASVSTMSNVNGAAFDSTGKGFLGSSNTLRSYNQPSWVQNPTGNITTSMSSTDLASCSSPPTIVIEKEVIGGRLASTDQFQLNLLQGTTSLGTATTAGNTTGIQEQRVGPQPTVRGVELSFNEQAAGTTDLSNYASAYQCTVSYTDGTPTQTLDEVTGTSGKITIPANGDAVRCVFRNAPLVADVTIIKNVTDALGKNPQPATGWTVGATAASTGTGTVTSDPATATQQTAGAAGSANWKFNFSDKAGTASLNVSETMQDDYEFQSASCEITRLNGNTSTQTLTSPDATAIEGGIAPGDTVVCTYVNKPTPGALEIVKVLDPATVPDGFGNIEFTGAYTCTLGGEPVASGTWSKTGAGDAVLTPAAGSPAADEIPYGANCTATENAPTGSTGLPNSSYEWDTPTVSPAVTIGAEVQTITVTNKAKRVYGAFGITKVVEGDGVAVDQSFSGGWVCTLGPEEVSGTWSTTNGVTWVSPGAANIPLGASCTATEDRSGVVLGDGYEWDGEPVITGPVVAVTGMPGEAATITVTNRTKLVVGSVSWEKVDQAYPNTHLGGSEWTITGPAGTDPLPGGPVLTVTDNTGQEGYTGPDTDVREGYFKVEGLVFGTYVLTETKAPEGYVLPANPNHEFTIGAENVDLVLPAITNYKPTAPAIPLTGGLGSDQFLIVGGGLLILAAGATFLLRRRRAEA